MKSFKFTLAPVLKHREWEEDNRKKDLAHVVYKLLKAEEAVRELTLKRESYHQKLKESTSKSIDIDELKLYHRYIQHLTRDIARMQLMVEKLRVEQIRKKEELVQAHRERRKIDKLKELELKEYSHQVKIFEQKVIDEVTSTRYAHGQQQG